VTVHRHRRRDPDSILTPLVNAHTTAGLATNIRPDRLFQAMRAGP
jgi:hypothetical protein